jgi:hypothetical protein
MARIYKRLPNNSKDQHEDLEAVQYSGNNINDVSEFVGYVPEIYNKHKASLKIINPHGTFALGIGQWVAKGTVQGNEIFYVMDHSIVARRWNVDKRHFEP